MQLIYYFILIITPLLGQNIIDTPESIPKGKKMMFRDPITFSPYNIKAGIIYNRGIINWLRNVTPDSTTNSTNTLNFGNGQSYELELLSTNILYNYFKQNLIDIQFGLGIQKIEHYLSTITTKDTLQKITYNNQLYNFNPISFNYKIHSYFKLQLSKNILTFINSSLGISKITFYKSIHDQTLLEGSGNNFNINLGMKYIIDNKIKNYNYILGFEVGYNNVSINKITTTENISPITGIIFNGFSIMFTTGIQFGGRISNADIGYSHMLNKEYIKAAQYFEKFLTDNPQHLKRKNAVEMYSYCKNKIPYQQVNIGINNIDSLNYDEAIKWFNSAELNANIKLKDEIKINKQKIAIELLDSVQNYKNNMELSDAIDLTKKAGSLYPESKQYSKILANLFFEKAKLNKKIGYYSGAINYFEKALSLDFNLEILIIEELQNLSEKLIEDAYFSFNEKELYLVLKSMNDFIRLVPKMETEFDPYIIKLESKIKEMNEDKIHQNAEEFIINRKHQSLNLEKNKLELGFTIEEVRLIEGEPKYIDKQSEHDYQFEMWTYNKNNNITRLYFKNRILIRIE